MQTTSLATFNFLSAHIINQSFKVWKGTVNYFLKPSLFLWSSVLVDGNPMYSESGEEEQWKACWVGPMLTFATNIWSFNFSGKMSGNTIKWRKPWVTTNSLMKKNWKFNLKPELRIKGIRKKWSIFTFQRKNTWEWFTHQSVPIQQSLHDANSWRGYIREQSWGSNLWSVAFDPNMDAQTSHSTCILNVDFHLF